MATMPGMRIMTGGAAMPAVIDLIDSSVVLVVPVIVMLHLIVMTAVIGVAGSMIMRGTVIGHRLRLLGCVIVGRFRISILISIDRAHRWFGLVVVGVVHSPDPYFL